MKLLTKLIFEFTPLVLFFIASAMWEGDFYRPTTVLVVTTAVSLVLTWMVFHQPALMAIINALTGIIAGSVTLIADNPMYVQLKPTIIGGIYGTILLVGLIINKPLFKVLLGNMLHLTEEGWRILTWTWIFYFAFITGLNEYVWRHYTFTEWAFFKIGVLVPLTIIYALPQVYFLKKYRTPDAEPLFGNGRKREPKETAKKRAPSDTIALRQPIR